MSAINGTVHRTIAPVMDIGGTHVTVANVDVENRTILPGHLFRSPLDSTGTAAEILATITDCASRLPARGAARWAIALPGPFDYEHGIGQYVGVGKFEALRGFDLRTALTRRLPGACDISFHNDAEAFGLGEWWAGAARGHRCVVGITLGTGVGSCFLRGGRAVRHGPGIPPEGRVDLLGYAGEPLEETVSRRAIRRAYAQATGDSSGLDVHEIALRAQQGDRAALGVFARTYRTLGTTLSPWIAAFEPTVLVVGGSIAASWDLIAEPLREGLDAAEPAAGSPRARFVLERAQHAADGPLLGAALLARG